MSVELDRGMTDTHHPNGKLDVGHCLKLLEGLEIHERPARASTEAFSSQMGFEGTLVCR